MGDWISCATTSRPAASGFVCRQDPATARLPTPSSRYGRNWTHISILSAARLGPTGAASSPQFRVPRPTGSSTSNGTRCLILPATRHRTSRYAYMRTIPTNGLMWSTGLWGTHLAWITCGWAVYRGRQAFSPRTSAKRGGRLRGRTFRALTRSYPAHRRLLQLRRLQLIHLVRATRVRPCPDWRQRRVRPHLLTSHRYHLHLRRDLLQRLALVPSATHMH